MRVFRKLRIVMVHLCAYIVHKHSIVKLLIVFSETCDQIL